MRHLFCVVGFHKPASTAVPKTDDPCISEVRCTRPSCGVVISTAPNHDPNWVYTMPGRCDGTEYCRQCGKNLKEETRHDFSEWQQGEVEPELETRVCDRCGLKEQRRRCKACGGGGQRSVTPEESAEYGCYPYEDRISPPIIPCPECDGEGFFDG